MPRFYVNKNAQANGDHEVHNADANCPHPALPQNQQDLGFFTSCHGAVAAARPLYSRANGCAYCCPECHTS